MILLLVLAADAVSAAIASGPEGKRTQARLILAAIWVGLAFQAKMIEAWLVLPRRQRPGLARTLNAAAPAPGYDEGR